jgi:hypothetical protein
MPPRYFFLAGAGGVGSFTFFMSICIVFGSLVGVGVTFTGTGADAGGGAWVLGAAGALVVRGGAASNTDVPSPALRVANIDNESDVSMNMIADMVVAFESKVADPRGPKAVCEPIPPNAPARSAALPLCRSTTMIRKMQTIT